MHPNASLHGVSQYLLLIAHVVHSNQTHAQTDACFAAHLLPITVQIIHMIAHFKAARTVPLLAACRVSGCSPRN